MNEYTASNGWTVNIVGLGANVHKGSENTPLYTDQVQDLREFFQAEADERLGRDRDALDPHFVFYPGRNEKLDDDYVNVLDEREASFRGAFYREDVEQNRRLSLIDGPYQAAAARYFAAHPEPKPWHDAKIGELWDVTTANQEEVRCFVVHDEPFSFVTADTTHHKPDSIIAATRIYPPADPS